MRLNLSYVWVILCIVFISSKGMAQTEIKNDTNNDEVKVIKNISWNDKDNLDSYYEEVKDYTINLPVVRQNTGYSKGTALHDILSYYYQAGYGACMQYSTYFDSALPTYAHEATHGLNACIRNQYGGTGTVNAFYLLNGKAVVLREPNVRKARVGGLIPAIFRTLGVTKRFIMYVLGQGSWDDIPLYIFDEWVAYTNGAREAISLLKQKKGVGAEVQLGGGALEFLVYGAGLGAAIEQSDPSYFQREVKFIPLFKHLSKITILEIVNSSYWQVTDNEMKRYWNNFKVDPSSLNLRNWIKKYCGNEWAKEVLGIN